MGVGDSDGEGDRRSNTGRESDSRSNTTAGEELEPGDGLAVGDAAPDFTASLVRPDGGVDDVSLSTLLEDGPVLLTFYTVDFSPDCIREWCSFRDFGWFESSGEVQVVGVSKSGPRLHREFIRALGITFPLYVDADLDIGRAYDVEYEVFRMFRRTRRSCFLVDEDRTVRYTWIGEHWLDPTLDRPPVGEIHDAIVEELGDGDGSPGSMQF